MTLKDDGAEKEFTIKQDALLTDGDAVGLQNQCYLGVYMIDKPSTEQNTYYIGSPIFDDHYISFSLDPYAQDMDAEHLMVALGQVCKTANLGDVVFNDKYVDYNSELQ